MKRSLLAMTALLIIAMPLTAQRQNRSDCDTTKCAEQRQNRDEMKQSRAELRTWFENEVFPEISAWRTDFDATLTADQRSTLAELRTEMKTVRESIHEEVQQLRETRNKKDRDQHKKQMREIRRSHSKTCVLSWTSSSRSWMLKMSHSVICTTPMKTR